MNRIVLLTNHKALVFEVRVVGFVYVKGTFNAVLCGELNSCFLGTQLYFAVARRVYLALPLLAKDAAPWVQALERA